MSAPTIQSVPTVPTDEETALAVWRLDYDKAKKIVELENQLKEVRELLTKATAEKRKAEDVAYTKHMQTVDLSQEVKEATDALHFANQTITQMNESKARYAGLLQNLLAVLHRDGGHYTARAGMVKSCKDAEEKAQRAYSLLAWLDDPLHQAMLVDSAAQKFAAWWQQEGHSMNCNVEKLCAIAWSNGAYTALNTEPSTKTKYKVQGTTYRFTFVESGNVEYNDDVDTYNGYVSNGLCTREKVFVVVAVSDN